MFTWTMSLIVSVMMVIGCGTNKPLDTQDNQSPGGPYFNPYVFPSNSPEPSSSPAASPATSPGVSPAALPASSPGASPAASPASSPGASPIAVTASISAQSTQINYATTTNLTWTSQGAVGCEVKVLNVSAVKYAGTAEAAGKPTDILYADTTYVITCTGNIGQKTTNSVLIRVNPPTDHFIFATGTFYNGNLGGVVGADGLCQQAADKEGSKAKLLRPGRPWKALLGTDTVDLSARNVIRGQVRNLNAETVSVLRNNVETLFGVNLTNPVRYSEMGANLDNVDTSLKAWSGAAMDGGSANDNCLNWTSNSSGERGNIGQVNQDDDWLRDTTTPNSRCDELRPIYCISE